MKKLVLVVPLVLILSQVFSENRDDINKNTFSISGKVVDKITGEPLTGVGIKLTGLNLTVYSDFEGNFSVNNILPGKYDLSVFMLAYKKTKKEKFLVSKENNNYLKIELEPLK